MTSDQLLALLTNITQPAIFAGLFIWLFVRTLDTTKERELWFRETMKEFVVTLRTISERLDSIDKKVNR